MSDPTRFSFLLLCILFLRRRKENILKNMRKFVPKSWDGLFRLELESGKPGCKNLRRFHSRDVKKHIYKEGFQNAEQNTIVESQDFHHTKLRFQPSCFRVLHLTRDKVDISRLKGWKSTERCNLKKGPTGFENAVTDLWDQHYLV